MKNDLTLNLHLLIARTDYIEQIEWIASTRDVGVGVLCEEVIAEDPEWVETVLTSENLRQEDIIHDFVGLLDRDEHFLPRI